MAGLDAIAAQPDQKHKIEQYKVALQQIVGSGSVKECKGFADHSKSLVRKRHTYSKVNSWSARNRGQHAAAVLSDNVPLVVSRQLLTTFAQELEKLPADSHKEVAI